MLTARSLSILLIMLLIGLQYKLWIAGNGVPETMHLRHQISHQMQVNQNYDKANQQLAAQVHKLKSSDTAVEGLARRQIGMVKPNETYYQFIK